MNFNLFQSKRKIDSVENEDPVVETKRFVSCFGDMSLFTFIKESSHLEKFFAKQKEITVGYFHLLPDEIFIQILKYLSVDEMGNFTLTNTKIRNFIIENFLISSSGYHHLIRASQVEYDQNQEKQFGILKLFSSIGLFLKKCTFVFPTQERIYLLIHALEHSYGIPSIKTFNYFNFVNFKFIFKCYAQTINYLIYGWGDFECANVFKTLKDISRMDINIEKFLKSSLGSKQKQELLIRHFFRMILHRMTSADYENTFKEKLFWLTQTLKLYSPTEIGKILIVTFGPLISINNSSHSLPYIAWWDLTDSNFVENGIQDLGLVFCILYRYREESIWKKEYILQLFDKTINVPSNWLFINVSTLLYHCGHDFTLDFFRKKLNEEKIEDVSAYLCYLNIISYKFSQDLKPVVKLIDLLIEEYGENLIEEIAHAFTTIIYDIDPINDEEEKGNLDISEVIESQIELMRLLMLSINSFKKFA